MKKSIHRPCPVCRNQDAETIKFICHEKVLLRLHCERCNCAFFNRFIPKKPKYDWKYNQEFFKDSEINKAVVMSQKIVNYAKKMFENPTVFEIGVGNGMTLKRIQNAGIPCEGVDIDERLCAYLKEKEHITVHAGGLERLQIKTQFDIVYSSHVIEHFEEPDLFMLKARQLIRGRGFLYLDTPNLDCSNGCDPAWHHFRTRDPWEHACVLSPRALLTLTSRHRLQVIIIDTEPSFGSFRAVLQKG
jgi:2-polyprenyl-3-methyl-5-hydroxy-6-metoxy-1,4-benzoquinol methylase